MGFSIYWGLKLFCLLCEKKFGFIFGPKILVQIDLGSNMGFNIFGGQFKFIIMAPFEQEHDLFCIIHDFCINDVNTCHNESCYGEKLLENITKK